MPARRWFLTDELWPIKSVLRQRSIRAPYRLPLCRKFGRPGLQSARSFPHLQCLGGNDRGKINAVRSLLSCQSLDRADDLGEKRKVVWLVIRIDAAYRLFKKRETANKDKLGLRTAHGYIHPTTI